MERILCAAIKRLNPRSSKCNYHHNDIHLIELGFRHHDIFIRFQGEVSRNSDDQGFYTSYGRFVDRKEAYKIAFEAGQITKKFDRLPTAQEPELFSEDLY